MDPWQLLLVNPPPVAMTGVDPYHLSSYGTPTCMTAYGNSYCMAPILVRAAAWMVYIGHGGYDMPRILLEAAGAPRAMFRCVGDMNATHIKQMWDSGEWPDLAAFAAGTYPAANAS